MKRIPETPEKTRAFLKTFGKGFEEKGFTGDGRVVFMLTMFEPISFLRSRAGTVILNALQRKGYCYTTWILASGETASGFCKELPHSAP